MTTETKNGEFPQNVMTALSFRFGNWSQVPIIDLQGRMGSTDYIDFLQIEDLKDHSVVKFKDCYGRVGMAFRAKIKKQFQDSKESKRTFVFSFFQRYSNSMEQFSCCINHDKTHGNEFDSIRSAALVYLKSVGIKEDYFDVHDKYLPLVCLSQSGMPGSSNFVAAILESRESIMELV